jgi:arsenate reductase (thioredoxin)
MAEAIVNHVGRGAFAAFTGSHQTGVVNPLALGQLARAGISTEGLRSKACEEFVAPDAPLDFAFTVCDNAAGEVCPVWPGQLMTAHWGVPFDKLDRLALPHRFKEIGRS